MAEENSFLPECRYQPTHLPSWKDCPNDYLGKIVHVLPTEFLKRTKKLFVCGNNFNGIIEEEELSIYPITYFDQTNMPRFLPKLFDHCITAMITGFSKGIFVLFYDIYFLRSSLLVDLC